MRSRNRRRNRRRNSRKNRRRSGGTWNNDFAKIIANAKRKAKRANRYDNYGRRQIRKAPPQPIPAISGLPQLKATHGVPTGRAARRARGRIKSQADKERAQARAKARQEKWKAKDQERKDFLKSGVEINEDPQKMRGGRRYPKSRTHIYTRTTPTHSIGRSKTRSRSRRSRRSRSRRRRSKTRSKRRRSKRRTN